MLGTRNTETGEGGTKGLERGRGSSRSRRRVRRRRHRVRGRGGRVSSGVSSGRVIRQRGVGLTIPQQQPSMSGTHDDGGGGGEYGGAVEVPVGRRGGN